MQATTTTIALVDNIKFAITVAKQILNYEGDGTITINLQKADIKSIVSALETNLGLKKVKLITDELPTSFSYESINLVMQALAKIETLKKMELNLSNVINTSEHGELGKHLFNRDFTRTQAVEVIRDKMSIVDAKLLDEIGINKLKLLESLKIKGYLRCVNLSGLLQLSSLTNLDLSNCSITYDSFFPFVEHISDSLTQLRNLDVSYNPIVRSSVVEDPSLYARTLQCKALINNLLKVMNIAIFNSNSGLIIDIDGCVAIGKFYYNFGDYTQLEAWKPIGAMLDHNKKLQSVADLEQSVASFIELAETVNVLEKFEEGLKNNTRFQRDLAAKKNELEQLRTTIERSLELLKENGFDAHHIHANLQRMSGEFIEAYKTYAAIPSTHKNYVDAQHQMMLLLESFNEDLIKAGLLDKKDMVGLPEAKINLQKLILYVQLATNVATHTTAEAAAVALVGSHFVGKYVTGQLVPLLNNPNTNFGCNLNTLATVCHKLREANKTVDQLTVRLKKLEEKIEELAKKQTGLADTIDSFNQQQKPKPILRQFPANQARSNLVRRHSTSSITTNRLGIN